MELDLLPTQEDILFELITAPNKKTKIISYVGGLGSGKTFIGTLAAGMFSKLYPESNMMYLAPSLQMAKDVTLPYLFKRWDEQGLTYEHLNKDKTLYLLSNGTKMWVTHGTGYSHFLTYEFNYIGVEEASKISNTVLKQAQGRLRYNKTGSPLIMLPHTNPPSSTNHFSLKAGQLFIASSRENTHLPEDYIENLCKNMTKEERDKFIDGKIGASIDSALIRDYDKWDIDYSNEIKLEEIKNVFIACDFNFTPQCWTSGVELNNGTFVFLNEHYVLSTSTREHAINVFTFLLNKYPGIKEIDVYGDSSGDFNQRIDNDYTIMDDEAFKLKLDLNIKILSHNPPIAKRLSVFKRLIKTQQYKFNIKNMKKTDFVFENTTIDIQTGKFEIPTKKDIEMEPDLVYIPHAIDGISYLMYYQDTIQ